MNYQQHPAPYYGGAGGGKPNGGGLVLILSLIGTILCAPWLHGEILPYILPLLSTLYGDATVEFWRFIVLILTYPLVFLTLKGVLNASFILVLIQALKKWM